MFMPCFVHPFISGCTLRLLPQFGYVTNAAIVIGYRFVRVSAFNSFEYVPRSAVVG